MELKLEKTSRADGWLASEVAYELGCGVRISGKKRCFLGSEFGVLALAAHSLSLSGFNLTS